MNEETDLYTELQQAADLFYRSGSVKKRKVHGQRTELQCITQNLQGFVKKRRSGWLRSWKQHTDSSPADVIYVQDTHLKTEKEIEDVVMGWNRVWGLKSPEHPLSYWTKMEGASGGTGILLNPKIASAVSPWKEDEWTGRRMALQYRGWKLVNVYAPNEKSMQNLFYRNLHLWIVGEKNLLLGGDFNAVLTPSLDRLTHGIPSSKSCENTNLAKLVDQLDLIDAVQLTTHASDDNPPDPLTHFSFWRNRSASRLDRFYLGGDVAELAQWVEARSPANTSDHQEVRLWLTLQQARKRRSVKARYPINSAAPEWLHKQIQKRIAKLKTIFLQQTCPARAWDTFAQQVSIMLREVARLDKERTSAYFNNIRSSLNCQATTREELQRIALNFRVRQGQRAFGRTLQPTHENMKRFYKRHADWQRDQTVSNILPSPGHFYPEKMSIADKMANEWNDIMGDSHASLRPEEMQATLRQFHTVPESERLHSNEQKELLKPILEGEVIYAIEQLPRDKSGGMSGLSHDFYKDFKDEMAECLAAVYQAIREGAAVPNSFLDAVVVPLRKKGDSTDAMDYRPISLLNTAYKILGRIYAERIHRFLPRIISSGQQGFVRGRLMTKSVTIVQAFLRMISENPTLDWANSPAILCLDERKAYDTLDRSFMLAALAEFGFPQGFLDVLHNLHTGTTARYLVNGEESSKWAVNSGIRQGCPLAPLLFVLAMDFLGRAISAHPGIEGLEIPNSGGKHHVFNGFVDDSTVFLSATKQIVILNQLLKEFGEMSGLKVQPQKSILIPLNTAWRQTKCHGYPVLADGDTVRILGYHFGTHDIAEYNWDLRIRNIKKRLQVATRITNSVKQRVLLFNTVVLPAILFTGMHIPMSKKRLKELELLQKRFIWKGVTQELKVRHKIAPGLVFAPEDQGGLGLQNIDHALKATRINQAEQWIQGSMDNYHAAWHWLAHSELITGRDCCAFTPTSKRQAQHAQRTRKGRRPPTIQQISRMELWADITEQQDMIKEMSELKDRVQEIRDSIICFWVRGDTIKCMFSEPRTNTPHKVNTDYWRTSKWDGNACIVDVKGRPLKQQDFPLFQTCSLMQLRVRKESEGVYLLQPPRGTRPFTIRHYRQLRRWCASIFAGVPPVVWISQLKPVMPKTFPTLSNQYKWISASDGSVIAKDLNDLNTTVFRLEQNSKGWTWSLKDRNLSTNYDKDANALKFAQNTTGLAFEETPFLHPSPWIVPRQTQAKMIRQTIWKARSKRLKKHPQFSIQHVLEKLKKGSERHVWARAAQSQQSRRIWQYDGILTDFQRWTIYRVCTRTLNLYHFGWPSNRSCPFDKCFTTVETIEHIVWDCWRAQELWKEWLPKWLGHFLHRDELRSLVPHLAARDAPPASPDFVELAVKSIPNWEEGYEEAMRVIWVIWTTITQCALWQTRNKEIFDDEHVTAQQAKQQLMKAADFQTQAVIRGFTSRPAAQALGFKVAQCYAVFTAMQPADRPNEFRRWTIIFHSDGRRNATSRRGFWMITRDTPQELMLMGITQSTNAPEEIAVATIVLHQALSHLKDQVLPSTVQLVIQGAKHLVHKVKNHPGTATAFTEFISVTWHITPQKLQKVIKAVIKSKRKPAIFSKANSPPPFWKSMQDHIPKTSNTFPDQDKLSIRHSLQRLQDSIVSS